MENKSKFLSPLWTSDDLTYAKAGSWSRNTSFNKLATLAKNLDTSKLTNYPDKLRSVPTPWARLLLFESALYDKDHPAHREIRDQWRGLLGVLGLADVLGLGSKLSIRSFDLANEPAGELRDAFMTLRPRHVSVGGDSEKGKWDSFSLIAFDDRVLGGTSPRTLVFTGIAHSCPSLIPFRSEHDRLNDPADYFRQHSPEFLSVLQQWLENLITKVGSDDDFGRWLGQAPTDRNAQQVSRQHQLLDALGEWRSDIGEVSSKVSILPGDYSRLPKPYDIIKHIEKAGTSADSDLFLRGHTDIIVGFHPKAGSILLDGHGNPVTGQPVRVFGGFQVAVGKSLPDKFDFLPSTVRVIQDPAELFEDALIETQIFDPNAVFCLSSDKKNYLLPFRKKIIEYFTESELSDLARTTQVSKVNSSTMRVEIQIPLVKGRSIRVYKDYHADQNIVTNDNLDHPTQELAMWPDFVCPGQDENGKAFFEHYFYYTSDVKRAGQVQVEFTPLEETPLNREISEKGMRWYMRNTPLQGFVGSVGDNSGLLLINHARRLGQTTKYWKVGVDFGSTHTSVFYREVEKSNKEWIAVKDSAIQPLMIEPRVRILTSGDAARIQENFFLYKAGAVARESQEVALTTQLSMPLSRPEHYPDSWLPREGQIFLGSILYGAPDILETDLKWDINRSNRTTSAFLRSLLIMLEAEAVQSGAQVVNVAHAYPTAFPTELKNKHRDEWKAVQDCVNIPVESEPLSEAVAVCRHLWKEQGGLPDVNKAAMIAMDVGGSTTDIAIWARKKLQIQESVKMAAGAISRSIESPSASEFREWFVSRLTQDGGTFNNHRIFLPRFSASALKRRGFHAALKRLSEDHLQDSFIKAIQAASRSKPEVRAFLFPVVFLFAALSYFAGLLAHKGQIGQSVEFDHYYIYFCGKGGQLLRWIPEPDGEAMAREMFIAGLLGPGNPTGSARPNASLVISEYPKEEVGRGLLIERTLIVDQKNQSEEMFAEANATVTVAEDGFPGVSWSDNLNYELLKRLKDKLPPIKKLLRLNHFVKAFSQSPLTNRVAAELHLMENLSKSTFRDTLENRLSDNLEGGQDKALIEPLFITETKVLIELMTDRLDLFD